MALDSSIATSLDVEVLESWRRFQARDGAAVLATLVAKEGSSPRPLGSQIAISVTGEATGYITGGCAEAAIAAEGIAALNAGASRMVRFGEGSKYADVKLPCGAGIDIAFSIDVDPEAVAATLQSLETRKAATLCIDKSTGLFVTEQYEHDTCFVRRYTPTILIDIVGKGPVVPALAKIARAAAFEVRVASPESETLAKLPALQAQSQRLGLPRDYRPTLDPWCASVVLFHEHDWEPEILSSLLSSDAFYIGALGSRKTHAERCEQLRVRGLQPEEIARVAGPIGVDIDAASPEEIAVSILAEIIAASHRKGADGKWRR